MPMAATATRFVSSLATASAGRYATEAPFTPLIFVDRLKEMLTPEVRPQHGRDVKFGVGELPEQEVADPLLARGPDQQVGIGQRRRVELARERRFINRIRLQLAACDTLRQLTRSPYDLRARAVADHQVQRQVAAAARVLHDLIDRPARRCREPVQLAEYAHLHTLALQLIALLPRVAPQQPHE